MCSHEEKREEERTLEKDDEKITKGSQDHFYPFFIGLQLLLFSFDRSCYNSCEFKEKKS
jgi:hypothetical protein